MRFLILLIALPCMAQNWSLQDKDLGWNSRALVTTYFHHSELQTQWASAALSHYTFQGNEHVLDFGCGDGKISALMSFRVPQGSVSGVDLSQEMVFFASKQFPYKNLSFKVSNDPNFSSASYPESFDLITSFCVFHLVPEPMQVLSHLKALLKPTGKLVATLPIGRNPLFFQAAAEAMQARGWSFPAMTPDSVQTRDPEKLKLMLTNSGFDLDYFQVVETRTSFSSKEELLAWFVGTLTANWNIPLAESHAFFNDLLDHYLALRPEEIDDDGFVYFSLHRIDFVATPKRI